MQPVAEENQQEIAPAALAPLKRWTPGRPWFITAAAMAIVCIPFATASWIYERQRVLPGLAIICGVLAVTWQYLLVAVILGVMLAVFVYVLGTLS